MNKHHHATAPASTDLKELGTPGGKSSEPSTASRPKIEVSSTSDTSKAKALVTGHDDPVSTMPQAENTFAISLMDQPQTHAQRQRHQHSSRVLVTLLFTDIVESTRHAERMGDAKWMMLLERHRRIVRRQLLLFDGREIDVPGDGFLAAFSTSTSAVKCARAVRAGLRTLGLEIRAGLHAGECELEIAKGNLVGIAVHIAARVVRIAEVGQILVSSTVRELVLGSGLQFSAGATHALKGLAHHWQLFSLRDDPSDEGRDWSAGLNCDPETPRILN